MSMPELDSVTHLLPDSVKEMIDLIGMPKTLMLIDRLGGTTWPFSKNSSKLRHLREITIRGAMSVHSGRVFMIHLTAGVPGCIASDGTWSSTKISQRRISRIWPSV